jgi:prophage regulatory protein
MNTPKRFLRLPAVIDLVGIKRTLIYERIKAGTFPAPVQIGCAQLHGMREN